MLFDLAVLLCTKSHLLRSLGSFNPAGWWRRGLCSLGRFNPNSNCYGKLHSDSTPSMITTHTPRSTSLPTFTSSSSLRRQRFQIVRGWNDPSCDVLLLFSMVIDFSTDTLMALSSFSGRAIDKLLALKLNHEIVESGRLSSSIEIPPSNPLSSLFVFLRGYIVCG